MSSALTRNLGGRPGGTVKYQPAEIIDALRASKGIIAGAARIVGCDRGTINNAIERWPEVREALEQIEGENLDVAEHKLLSFIGADSERSVHFYLRTKGRDRGYAERHEVTGRDGAPVETIANLVARVAGRDVPSK